MALCRVNLSIGQALLAFRFAIAVGAALFVLIGRKPGEWPPITRKRPIVTRPALGRHYMRNGSGMAKGKGKPKGKPLVTAAMPLAAPERLADLMAPRMVAAPIPATPARAVTLTGRLGMRR